MVATIRRRRMLNLLLAAALILGQAAGFVALPRPAAAALSADPNAEIIYIDNNEVIRVLDTQGDPLVQWFSPDAGWDRIALLDVNDDGDMEILALDQQNSNLARISVFDPVAARGSSDPNKQINGIPWDLLYTTTVDGAGEYVVGGNFDANIAGEEFAVGYRHGDTSLVRIYNANSLDPGTQKPTGRDWKIHIQKEYPEVHYAYGMSGNLDDEGADELILIDSENTLTTMDVFRPDQDMVLTDFKNSDNDVFKFGAVGQLEDDDDDGREEWVAILTVTRPDKVSLRTFNLQDNGEIDEDTDWAFSPQPDWVFLADIRGNGDEEIFFLRNYREGSEGPRLIMRDDWGSDNSQNRDLIEWSLMDNGRNNEFRMGAGGDVDGDGRDEVIIGRDDRIRVYHRPETGNDGSSNFNDYLLPTDNSRMNLLTGDLDRNGFTSGPILLVSGNMVDAIVPAGSVSQDFTISVENIGTNGGVGINAIIPGGAPWATVNPTFALTPVNFRVRLNATNLQPGIYNTTMTLRSNASNVINDNYVVYLNLTVVPPVLQPSPPILSMFRLPCENDPCSQEEIDQRNEPFTTTIEIDGTDDLAFRTAIIGVPELEEASVANVTGGLPGPITGGEVNKNGEIIIYDDLGNSRNLSSEYVSAAAALSTTVMVDPELTWITTATLSSDVVPADLSLGIDPTILTEEFQREYAAIILVADTRAGTPSGNITIIPVQLANIGGLIYVVFVTKQ